MLKPSKIQGVGVFATHHIAKDTFLRLYPGEGIHRVKAVKMPFIKYCHLKGAKYIAPPDFGRMAVGWFLNHSTKPNAYYNKKYESFALRDIKKGEEITIDYRTL